MGGCPKVTDELLSLRNLKTEPAFPSFKLKPGKSVKLHSGKGSNTSSNLYWDRGWYVWNNDGDKAILRSSSGTLTDTCAWGDGIGYKNC